MAKAPNATEIFEAHVLANAHHWTAFQFRGVGNRQKADDLTSREAAREVAAAMLANYPDRPVMIYAVTAEGRSAHIENVGA